MTELTYNYEILEIISDDERSRNGAKVRYTCTVEGWPVQPIEMFVPVPFEKATDKAHALELLEKKCESRAPTRVWRKQMREDKSGNTVDIGNELAADLGVPRNAANESVNPEGDQRGTRVSNENRHQGGRVGDDGLNTNEAEGSDERPPKRRDRRRPGA